RQHPGLVLDQHRQDVVALADGAGSAGPAPDGVGGGVQWRRVRRHRAASWSGWTTMSSLDAPAGTIGKTFSRASVRKSTTTGRSSTLLAFSMAGATSSGDSARMPTHPMA